jgi:hypothetical protein
MRIQRIRTGTYRTTVRRRRADNSRRQWWDGKSGRQLQSRRIRTADIPDQRLDSSIQPVVVVVVRVTVVIHSRK